jgi:hypothetical protein
MYPVIYMVCGYHPDRGVWLTATDDEYDGYDGDLIVEEESEGWFVIQLRDERSSLPGRVRLVPVVSMIAENIKDQIVDSTREGLRNCQP